MAIGAIRPAKTSLFNLDASLPLRPHPHPHTHTYPLLAHSDMTFHPPDQQSPDTTSLDQPILDPTLIRSPIDHLEFRNTLTAQDSSAHAHLLANKKRRSSKTKLPAQLRRSVSTPHMRNMALGTAGDLSPTNSKARNKLGYHRTSVACGHCRRRKIRCLLAPDDPQGRCANCIRLKKECNFYPVEHSLELQRSDTATSKDASTGTPSTSAATSPHHPVPVPGENMPEFRPPFPGVVPANRNPAYGFPTDVEVDPHQPLPAGGVPVQPSFPYPHPIETQWPPATNFLPSSTVAESPASTPGYWKVSPSTANSAYGSESNVSGAHTPAAMSSSSTMSYGPQDTHSWTQHPSFQPPTRSMSYGNIEGLPPQYRHGLGIQPQAPYPYPTSLDTAANMNASTIGCSTTAPLSAPIVPNHPFYPPTWTSYEGMQSQAPPMQMPGRSMSAQWYPESSHLDQVQEEVAPSMAFHPQDMPQFYSGA